MSAWQVTISSRASAGDDYHVKLTQGRTKERRKISEKTLVGFVAKGKEVD